MRKKKINKKVLLIIIALITLLGLLRLITTIVNADYNRKVYNVSNQTELQNAINDKPSENLVGSVYYKEIILTGNIAIGEGSNSKSLNINGDVTQNVIIRPSGSTMLWLDLKATSTDSNGNKNSLLNITSTSSSSTITFRNIGFNNNKYGWHGIYTWQSQAHLTLENCYIQNAPQIGMLVTMASSNITINNTVIHDNGFSGLNINNGCTVSVNNGRIIDNGSNFNNEVNEYGTVISGYPGVNVGYSYSKVTITGTEISGNKGNGIEAQNNGTAIVSSASIHDNGKTGTAGYNGILVRLNGYATITSSKIYNNMNCGMEVSGLSSVTITNTPIYNNGANSNGSRAGIHMTDSANVIINNNSSSAIYGNVMGIRVLDNSKLEATSIYVRDNTDSAIDVDTTKTTESPVQISAGQVTGLVRLWSETAGSYIYTSMSNLALSVWCEEPKDQRKIVGSNNATEYTKVTTTNSGYKVYKDGNDTKICSGHTVTLTTGNYIDSVSGGGTKYATESVTAKATVKSADANYTYAWKNWTGSSTSTNQNYTFTMGHSNISLTANGTRTSRNYSITYNLNGGTNNSDNPGTYTVGTTVTFKDPTKQGYTFKGWYEDSAFTESKKITSTANKTGNLNLYAKWEARTDTAYKIEHYKENASGNYTLEETEDKKGTTGATVNATPKTYSGYSENTTHEGRKASGTVAANGSLVLKLYYKLNAYTITYNLNGGTNNSDNPGTYTVGTTVTFKDPTKQGYTFKGWYEDSAFTESKKITSTANKTGDLNLYAKWEARTDTAYKVEHYKENASGNYTLEETEDKTGTTGETVNATPKTYSGYSENTTHEGRKASGTVAANGSLVLKLYYKLNAYTITYNLNGGTNNSDNPGTYTVAKTVTFKDPTKQGYTFKGWYEDSAFTESKKITSTANKTGNLNLYAKWEAIPYTITYNLNGGTNNSDNPGTYTVGKTETFKDPTKQGYTFKGWYEDSAFTESKKITSTANKTGNLNLYAKWEARTDTAYKVEHYKENASGNYTLEETEDKTGTTGETVNATPKTYSGYSENTTHEGRKASGTVAANGSLVLKLYYKLNAYTITYNLNGGTNNSDNPGTYTVGTTVTFKDPTKQGYTFKGWYEDSAFTESKKITSTANKTGNLNLYAKWEAIPYTITYNLNGGTNNSDNPGTYTVGTTVTFKDPTKQGYTFKGWYEDSAFTESKKITSTANKTGNLNLYAKWEARTDTAYKVEHYKENASGNYTLEETEDKKGTTGATVNATPKTYSGYSENTTHEGRKASGTVGANGSLVLKLYYKLNAYTITYNLNGGTNNSDNPGTYTVGTTVTFKDPTKQGYTFKGWYEDSAFTESKKIESTANKTGNLSLYAKWEVRTDTIYTVIHYKKEQEGTYKVAVKEFMQGETDSKVTAIPKDFVGYVENSEHPERENEGIIKADGSLILKFYYDPVIYNIEYETNGGKNSNENPKTYTVTDVVNLKPATKEGYEFKGWYEDEKFEKKIDSIVNRTGDIKVYAKWEAEKDTGYKVQYYKKNEKGEYELVVTDKLTGITDTEVTAESKEYEGYKENLEYIERKAKGKVKADGSLVLKLYYDPIVYKINYVLNGGVNNENNPTTYTVEDEVDLWPANKEGYDFMGWYEDENFNTKIDSIVNRTENITVYAKWKARTDIPYKVEHYKEGKDGKYELAVTERCKGEADTEVTAVPRNYGEYNENTKHPDRLATAKIKPDGSLILKLYYEKVSYKVTFDPQNGKKVEDQKIKHEETAKEPNKQEKEGYEFKYWYYIDKNGKKVVYDFNTPVVEDLHLIAEWEVAKDDTVAPDPIPQTGILKNPFVVIALFVAAIAIIFGVKYFRLRDIKK